MPSTIGRAFLSLVLGEKGCLEATVRPWESPLCTHHPGFPRHPQTPGHPSSLARRGDRGLWSQLAGCTLPPEGFTHHRPGRGVPSGAWEESWEESSPEAVTALIPQVLLGLGDQGRTVEKGRGFWAGLSGDFPCADQHLCSAPRAALNQNIPDESRFLSYKLVEPVGAPEQELDVSGCSPPASGGGGLHHSRPSDPQSDPSRSPCRHSPSHGWG